MPPGVEEAPGQKHKRKGATKLQNFHKWYKDAYAEHPDGRRARWKGPTFADMEVLYWKHVKEQLETLQKLRRRKINKRWLPGAKQDLWPTEEDLGVADDFLEPEEYVEEPAGVMPKAAADLDAEAMRYKELVRRNVELFIATSQKCIQETELSQRIRDWEDKIQPLLHEACYLGTRAWASSRPVSPLEANMSFPSAGAACALNCWASSLNSWGSSSSTRYMLPFLHQMHAAMLVFFFSSSASAYSSSSYSPSPSSSSSS